jgi:exodeoxyribonuclease VII small subunit
MTNPELFNFEASLSQLEAILRQLESGEGSLEEAIALFEQGQGLVRVCQKYLDIQDLRIQQILEDDRLVNFET